MLDYSKINLIKSVTNKRGNKMYYYYSKGAGRWIRLKKADAEYLLATEQVEDVTDVELAI